MAVLTVRELFEFVVDPTITDDTLDASLDRLMEVAARCGAVLHRQQGLGGVLISLYHWYKAHVPPSGG